MRRNLKIGIQFLLYCWFGLCVGLSFLLFFPVMALLLIKPEWYRYAHTVRRAWVRLSLRCGWIRVERVFEVPLEDVCYVITPNHTSKLDMMVLPSSLPIYLSFAADKSFRSIPLFGLFFRTIDVAVDLKNPRAAATAFKQGLTQLRSGKSMVVFPEGMIARKTPKLSPFKEGAFKMAIVAGRPVLPITFIHSWELLPDAGPLQFRPGKVIMYVHAPISTQQMKPSDAGKLAQQVSDMIGQTLQRYGYNPHD